MPDTDNHNFAHGTYGDESGVIFHGPPARGFWDDKLPVSERYIDPLFCAAIDRAKREGVPVSSVLTDWRTVTGWSLACERQALCHTQAKELIDLLARVTEPDLIPHVGGVTPTECIECAAAIAAFLRTRIERGIEVYIEDD